MKHLYTIDYYSKEDLERFDAIPRLLRDDYKSPRSNKGKQEVIKEFEEYIGKRKWAIYTIGHPIFAYALLRTHGFIGERASSADICEEIGLDGARQFDRHRIGAFCNFACKELKSVARRELCARFTDADINFNEEEYKVNLEKAVQEYKEYTIKSREAEAVRMQKESEKLSGILDSLDWLDLEKLDQDEETNKNKDIEDLDQDEETNKNKDIELKYKEIEDLIKSRNREFINKLEEDYRTKVEQSYINRNCDTEL